MKHTEATAPPEIGRPVMRYRIVPKRDFGSGPGYWLPNAGNTGTEKYGYVKRGFVVTDGVCNVMPGAIWFRTIPDAMRAIRVHMETGDTMAFWDVYRGELGCVA